jgi:hypothetical protein
MHKECADLGSIRLRIKQTILTRLPNVAAKESFALAPAATGDNRAGG